MRIETLMALLVFCTVFLALIRNGESKCTPIKMVITVRLAEEAKTVIYAREKYIKTSSSFQSKYQQNKDQWDVSLSANVEIPGLIGGGWSAAGGRAWEQTVSSAISKSDSVERDLEKKDEYNPLKTQLYEIVTTDVTIDGATATTEERFYRASYPIEQSTGLRTLRQQAEEHVRYTYGDIPGGKIRKNTYTASSCISEGRNNANEVFR